MFELNIDAKPRSLDRNERLESSVNSFNDSLDDLANNLSSLKTGDRDHRHKRDRSLFHDECPPEERIEMEIQNRNFTAPSAPTKGERRARLAAITRSLMPFISDLKSRKDEEAVAAKEKEEDLVKLSSEDTKKEEKERRAQRMLRLRSETFDDDEVEAALNQKIRSFERNIDAKPRSFGHGERPESDNSFYDSLDALASNLSSVKSPDAAPQRPKRRRDLVDDECPPEERIEMEIQSRNFTAPTEDERRASLAAITESLIPFTSDLQREKDEESKVVSAEEEKEEDLVKLSSEDAKKEEKERRAERMLRLRSETFEDDEVEAPRDPKVERFSEVSHPKPPFDDLRVSADFASHEGPSSDTMGEISEDQLDDEDDFMEMEEKAEIRIGGEEEMDDIEKVEDLRGQDPALLFMYPSPYGMSRTSFGASLDGDDEMEEEEEFEEQLWQQRSPRGYYPNKFTNPSGLMSIEEDVEEDLVRDDKSTSTDSLELPETSVDESMSSHSKKQSVRPKPRWLNFSREKRKEPKDNGADSGLGSGMNVSLESSQSGTNLSLSTENLQHEEVPGESRLLIGPQDADALITLPEQVIKTEDKKEVPQLSATASPGPVLSAPPDFHAKTRAAQEEKRRKEREEDVLVFTKPPIELPNIEAIRSDAFPSQSFIPRPRPSSYITKDSILEPAGPARKKPQELSFQEKLALFGGKSQDEKSSKSVPDRPTVAESAERRRNLFSRRDPSHVESSKVAMSLDSGLSRTAPARDWTASVRASEREQTSPRSPRVTKSFFFSCDAADGRSPSEDSTEGQQTSSPREAPIKRIKTPSVFAEKQESSKEPDSPRDSSIKRLQTPSLFRERSDSPKAPDSPRDTPVRRLQTPSVFEDKSNTSKAPDSPRETPVRRLQTPSVFEDKSSISKAPDSPRETPVRRLQTPSVFEDKSNNSKAPDSPRESSIKRLHTPSLFRERSDSPKAPDSPRDTPVRRLQTPSVFEEKSNTSKALDSPRSFPKDFRPPLEQNQAVPQRISSFESPKAKVAPAVPVRKRLLPQEPPSKPDETVKSSISNRRSLPANFSSEAPSYVTELSKKFAAVNEEQQADAGLRPGDRYSEKDSTLRALRQSSLEAEEEAQKAPRPSWSHKEPVIKSRPPPTSPKSNAPTDLDRSFNRASSPAKPGRGLRFKAYVARLNSEDSEEEPKEEELVEEEAAPAVYASLPEVSSNANVDTSNTVRPSVLKEIKDETEEQDFEQLFANATEEDLVKLSAALGMDMETARAIVDAAKPEAPDPERDLYRRLENVDGLSEEELLQVGIMMGMDPETAKMVSKYVAMQNRKEPAEEEPAQGNRATPAVTSPGPTDRPRSLDVLSRDSPALDMPETNEYGFMFIRPLVRSTPSREEITASREPAPLSDQMVAMMDQFAGLGELSTGNTPGTSARLSPASSVNSDYVRLMSQFDRLAAMSVDDSMSERDTLSVISENEMVDPARRLGLPTRLRSPSSGHRNPFEDVGTLSAPEDDEDEPRQKGSSLRRSNSDRPSRAKQLDRIRRLIERKRKTSEDRSSVHVPFA